MAYLQYNNSHPIIAPYYLPVWQPLPVNRVIQINHCITQAEVDYRNDMRSLWEEHVAWTRMAIISLVFNLPDIDEVLTRLLKNATDMGNMIRRLYGECMMRLKNKHEKWQMLFLMQ